MFINTLIIKLNIIKGVPVSCPSCLKEFCSLCSATWHSGLSCSENGALLVAKANKSGISNTTAEDCGLVWASDEIKKCPMCSGKNTKKKFLNFYF